MINNKSEFEQILDIKDGPVEYELFVAIERLIEEPAVQSTVVWIRLVKIKPLHHSISSYFVFSSKSKSPCLLSVHLALLRVLITFYVVIIYLIQTN